MLSFEKQYTIASQTFPGVSFVIRRLSAIERANRDLEAAEEFDRLDELRRQFASLPDDSAADTPDQAAQRAALNNRCLRLIQAKIFPVVIRAGIIAIEGFDGSVDDLLAYGDEALVNEAYALCESCAKLSADQLKNLASPGTSDAAVAGQSETTNAATASKAA